MQIIIVGCGNVGATLAEQLSSEGHNISVIDTDNQRLQNLVNSYDVMGVIGNGVSFAVQERCGGGACASAHCSDGFRRGESVMLSDRQKDRCLSYDCQSQKSDL